MRLLRERRAGRTVRHPERWITRAVRNLAADRLRGRATELGPLPDAVRGMPDDELPGPGADPALAAQLRDDLDLALARIDRLPPPYREIAHLQYVAGWTRPEVVTYLRAWRPESGDGTCARLLGRTHEMLRALGEGADPRRRWPRRYAANENRWIDTPPPPIPRH